jgi:hypothetical protein
MSLITGAVRLRTGSKRSSEYAERFADSDIDVVPRHIKRTGRETFGAFFLLFFTRGALAVVMSLQR